MLIKVKPTNKETCMPKEDIKANISYVNNRTKVDGTMYRQFYLNMQTISH